MTVPQPFQYQGSQRALGQLMLQERFYNNAEPAVLTEIRKARETEKKEKRRLKSLRKLDEPDRMNFRQAQAPAAKTAQNRILTPRTALWQHRAVVGGSENQFSLTGATLNSRGAQYQFNQ